MARGTTRLAVPVLVAVSASASLVALSGTSSLADDEADVCARCAPVMVRAVTDHEGLFIARNEAEAMKSASELAYRVGSERVVRKVRQTRLRCPDRQCAPGADEITTGIEDSPPCRRGSLGDPTRNRRLAKKRLAQWRKACVETLGEDGRCDDAEVQRAKPAWATCRVEVWAKKTRPCAPSRCRPRHTR